MTNFAACKTKRSFWKQNATLLGETLSNSSRATNRVGQSVLSNRSTRLHNNANGNQIGEWNYVASIYSGNSGSTLNNRAFSATAFPQQPSTTTNCCCRNDATNSGTVNIANVANNQRADQTSVISSNYLSKSQKCGLCKEQIKFFKEQYLCGHVFHGECIWRYEKLNPTYLSNQCPKNCIQRLMMVKRTRSIESRSSNSSSTSSSCSE